MEKGPVVQDLGNATDEERVADIAKRLDEIKENKPISMICIYDTGGKISLAAGGPPVDLIALHEIGTSMLQRMLNTAIGPKPKLNG